MEWGLWRDICDVVEEREGEKKEGREEKERREGMGKKYRLMTKKKK